MVFVDGPGGTGKIFLFQALLDSVRRNQEYGGVSLAVASSGTAALLLRGGRTAHSMFKIPLNCIATSVCNIPPMSDLAKLIRMAKLIVWDEASMISRNVFDAVDRSFRDIMKVQHPALESVPFGGKVIVFGSDFRQVLPVVHKGTKMDIINQCINRSPTWRFVKIFKLVVNMRVEKAISAENSILANTLQQFSRYLLDVGNGNARTVGDSELIKVPDDMLLTHYDVKVLADAIYRSILYPGNNTLPSCIRDQVATKAILAPKNSNVIQINDYIMDRFPFGETFSFYSSDKAITDESDAINFPVEYLNSINPGGLPPHHLKLKIGSPIMLLRNLDPKNGLCNGTCLLCRSFHRTIIEAEIATGPNSGQTAFIPRVTLESSAEVTGILFKRCQFPVRAAFAMTINKAQGQTLEKLGIYLPSPVFPIDSYM